MCAQLSARSKRATEEAAKRRGHGLGEPLLLPGTAGLAVCAGAARGLPAPRVPDARLHQPLGSQNRRRLPGGQPHSQQVWIHQPRTGKRWLVGLSALKLRGQGRGLGGVALVPSSSIPLPPSRCALAAVALTLERCSRALTHTHTHSFAPQSCWGLCFVCLFLASHEA